MATASASTSPFRFSGFRALLSTYAIAEIGDQFAIVALAVLVYERTSSPYAIAATFLVGKFLPALASTALVARMAHMRAVHSLTALLLAQVVCYGALAAIAQSAPRLGYLLPVLLIEGLFAVTVRGLSRGVVAMTLDDDETLRRGNAIINIIFGVGTVLGPILAVLILERWSAPAALAAAGGAFLLCAVVIAAGGRELPTAELHEAEQRHSTREGLRYTWSSPLARRLVVGQAVAMGFGTVIVPIEVVYVSESLHESASAFGWLLAAWGGGILAGSAIFARSSISLDRLVPGATALIGIGLVVMALAPTIGIAIAGSAIGGIGNGIQWVAVLTALQQSVSSQFYARTSGLLESVMSGVPGIAYPVGAVIAGLAGPRNAYALSGAGVLMVAGYWAMTRAREKPEPDAETEADLPADIVATWPPPSVPDLPPTQTPSSAG